MPNIPDDLNGALALNICRTREGSWQASLEKTRGAFSIRVAETPEAAIAALFPIPPCPLPPV